MSSDVAIERVEGETLLDRLRSEVVEVWASAHDLPRASPTRLEFGRERLPRHAGRADFRFLAAFGPGRELAGFAYGYTGAPGQWWYDRVAAALDADGRGRWIEERHFELTELAVRPDFQGRGVGTRLLEAVLAGLTHRAALLSALADNARVVGFYRGRGWDVVLDRLRFERGRPAFTIMGRRLDRPTD